MKRGCIHDLMDGPQEMEMDMNAKLAKRANELGVQVIIEGMGGYVSPEKIPAYVAHSKKKTDHSPLFVAGPLPLDIGVGYDHISGCVCLEAPWGGAAVLRNPIELRWPGSFRLRASS